MDCKTQAPDQLISLVALVTSKILIIFKKLCTNSHILDELKNLSIKKLIQIIKELRNGDGQFPKQMPEMCGK